MMLLSTSGSFLHMPTVANKLLEVMTHSVSPRSLTTALNYENYRYTELYRNYMHYGHRIMCFQMLH